MKKINKQAGFTLIELIMVIVILGVLSAFALPRFADLGQNARAATVQGAAASVKSAANIAHAQWLAEGDAASLEVTLEGVAIVMVNGYPSKDSIDEAAGIIADDYDITVGTTNDVTIDAKGATTATTCRVTYTEAAAVNSSPTFAVDTDGC